MASSMLRNCIELLLKEQSTPHHMNVSASAFECAEKMWADQSNRHVVSRALLKLFSQVSHGAFTLFLYFSSGGGG
jgi:hypothetical protein